MPTAILAPGTWTNVQGYDLQHTAPAGQTVTVDEEGAVHLPPLDDYADERVRWAARDEGALAPLTVDPDPVEDPAGRFELVDGTWRPL